MSLLTYETRVDTKLNLFLVKPESAWLKFKFWKFKIIIWRKSDISSFEMARVTLTPRDSFALPNQARERTLILMDCNLISSSKEASSV